MTRDESKDVFTSALVDHPSLIANPVIGIQEAGGLVWYRSMSSSAVAAESAAADVAIGASDSAAPEWKLTVKEGGSSDGDESDAKPSTNDIMMLEGASGDHGDSEEPKPGTSTRAREVRLDQNRKVSAVAFTPNWFTGPFVGRQVGFALMACV